MQLFNKSLFNELAIENAVNCRTRALAKEFLALAEAEGYTWGNGDPPTEDIHFYHDKNTCYFLMDRKILVADVAYAKTNKHPLYEFKHIDEPIVVDEEKEMDRILFEIAGG